MNLIHIAIVTAVFLGSFALAVGFGAGVLYDTLARTGAKKLNLIYSLFWVFVFPAICATAITYQVNARLLWWLL